MRTDNNAFNQEKMQKRLRELRKEENNLTMEQLAEKMSSRVKSSSKENKKGKTKSLICAWEKGRSIPSHEDLTILSELYGVSINYILGISEYRKKENEDVGKTLGLSEKSYIVLKKFLDIYMIEDEGFNDCIIECQKNIYFINAVLESIYPYFESNEDNENIPPVSSLFTLLYDYVMSKDVEINHSTAGVIDTNVGGATMTNAQEIYLPFQREQILKMLESKRVEYQKSIEEAQKNHFTTKEYPNRKVGKDGVWVDGKFFPDKRITSDDLKNLSTDIKGGDSID